MQAISSKQNPFVSGLRSLWDAKGRTETGCFLVEGWTLCQEALLYASVKTILVDEAKVPALNAMLAPAAPDGMAVLSAPAFILRHVCQAKTPQGIAASVRLPGKARVESIQGNVLALDGVQDPGNVGALIRTAEAAGFAAVLLSAGCADPFAPKAVRATMGSLFRVPLLQGDLRGMLSLLRANRYALVSAEPRGASVLSVMKTQRAPIALIIGSEGNGISNEVLALSDCRVALPMRGKVESLNAAVAAGILMYAVAYLPSCAPPSAYAKQPPV